MSELKKPSKPTHTVCVKVEGHKGWEKVGVGWINDFGAINVKLSPLIDLSRMGPRDIFKIFPLNYNEGKPKRAPLSSPLPLYGARPPAADPTPEEEGSLPEFGDDDSDVPF